MRKTHKMIQVPVLTLIMGRYVWENSQEILCGAHPLESLSISWLWKNVTCRRCQRKRDKRSIKR